MTAGTIYGAGLARITLRDASGEPADRYTFQSVSPEGLALTWTPEGTAHALGSGAYNRKAWVSRGTRASLALNWAYGLRSVRETWTGAAWASPTYVATQEAVARVADSSMRGPCLVEPHLDHAWAWEAQPDLQPLELADIKGLAHTGLQLGLVARAVAAFPTWCGSPVGADLPDATGNPDLVLHANRPPRFITYDAAGLRTARYTLQMPDRGGRVVTYTPDGAAFVGALPDRLRSIRFRGWRPSLRLQWAGGNLLTPSTRETWSGSAWTGAADVATAEALAAIAEASEVHDVQAEPWGDVDSWAAWQGRVYGQALTLRDRKALAHTQLELQLEGVSLLSSILDPASTYAEAHAFSPGYVS